MHKRVRAQYLGRQVRPRRRLAVTSAVCDGRGRLAQVVRLGIDLQQVVTGQRPIAAERLPRCRENEAVFNAQGRGLQRRQAMQTSGFG